jgi:hypothetical protein
VHLGDCNMLGRCRKGSTNTSPNSLVPLMVASLRYFDMFVQIDGAWLFSERQLYVDWVEERSLS